MERRPGTARVPCTPKSIATGKRKDTSFEHCDDFCSATYAKYGSLASLISAGSCMCVCVCAACACEAVSRVLVVCCVAAQVSLFLLQVPLVRILSSPFKQHDSSTS